MCSRLVAIEEIVADVCTGLHFTPGDADDLAQTVEWAWTHPAEMAMGRATLKCSCRSTAQQSARAE
jgi:hypothetical protein